jgi:short subunit dehydrogenase-like uncharacterized protein
MRLFACASLLLVASGFGSTAHANVLSGDIVRVAIAGRLERAVALRPHAGSWQLALRTTSHAAPLTRVELVDETSRTHEKWVLPVEGPSVQFDTDRFVPTHSYSVEVYAQSTLVERGVVYLYGDRTTKRAHVTFGAHDLLEADAELRPQPKGTL